MKVINTYFIKIYSGSWVITTVHELEDGSFIQREPANMELWKEITREDFEKRKLNWDKKC